MLLDIEVVLPYFLDENVNCAEIGRKYNIPARNIRRLYQKVKKNVPFSEIRPGGRHSKIAPCDRQAIGQYLRNNIFHSAKDIQKELFFKRKLEVSDRTVRRCLNDLGYSNGKPQNVPMLTDSHKQKRIDFAHKYFNFDWKTVIFSDE
jgi:transposase